MESRDTIEAFLADYGAHLNETPSRARRTGRRTRSSRACSSARRRAAHVIWSRPPSVIERWSSDARTAQQSQDRRRRSNPQVHQIMPASARA
jgi:hypothetical protein